MTTNTPQHPDCPVAALVAVQQEAPRLLRVARNGLIPALAVVLAFSGHSECVRAQPNALVRSPAQIATLTASKAIRAITRNEAIAEGLLRGPRISIARADSGAAVAQLRLARQMENPAMAVGYSESAPQQHYALEIPVDVPWQRGPRIKSAMATLVSANLRQRLTLATMAYDVDTAYTSALRASMRARLSERSARDADSLLVLATLRRDAGDASELDVQLAGVFAGQSNNAAAIDANAATNTLLSLQSLIGLGGDTALFALSDSLVLPQSSGATAGDMQGHTLPVAAAESDLLAAQHAFTLEKRRQFGAPSVSLGFEAGDPSGPSGPLPTVGVSIPFPLFHRNAAGTQLAAAIRDRRIAELELTRLDMSAQLAESRRTSLASLQRATRSAQLVQTAERIAALSLVAYREGASSLATVLESQRAARESLMQFMDDVADALNARARLQLLSLTADGHTP